MWIAKNTEWHESHTELTKYFIERIKQKVDPTEVISNKHRTTNGYTMIIEIVTVAELVKRRPKFIRRLKSLFDEAKCKKLSSNVINDTIIKKYFPDIQEYFAKTDFEITISDKSLTNFILKQKVFSDRLANYYHQYLEKEFNSIDFKDGEFRRNADKIDKLIDLLIPLILYHGYSTTSISNISYRFVAKDKGLRSPLRIRTHFDGNPSDLKFLLHVPKESEEFKYIKGNLNKDLFDLKVVQYDEIKDELVPRLKVQKDYELIQLSHPHIDPHNFLRSIYDQGIKRYVASGKRLSLRHFNEFFDNSFWKFSKAKNHKFDKSKVSYDPINVIERVSTLQVTLNKISKDYGLEFDNDKELPIIYDLHQPVYYYNLALGSKSIENSLSLLWTSLESLVPYRTQESDIDNIKYFVGKSLSFGALSRDLMGFITRCVELNNLDKNCLAHLEISSSFVKYTPNGISHWANWLTTEFEVEKDPYDTFKVYSNLLCKSFCDLNDAYSGKDSTKSKVKYWIERIESSRMAIEYQLDRIYLHRNQIVHSGKFINEYSNLWSNLEWYVGKLLSYAFIKLMQSKYETLESAFIELESDHDQLANILEVNKDKQLNEIKDSFNILFKHPWQAF
ncbi:hypothetical protein [Algoriphagus confluentis]|uniref:Apea-like HEPN domain-containing protein n=1 Tax=Algoriphagus confluentis TaxID=1697556 RepID=A0ABQ6PSG6_9BACT|nr:hypothetical protein Aconfl_33060 [Algoriphagus confluentis]